MWFVDRVIEAAKSYPRACIWCGHGLDIDNQGEHFPDRAAIRTVCAQPQQQSQKQTVSPVPEQERNSE